MTTTPEQRAEWKADAERGVWTGDARVQTAEQAHILALLEERDEWERTAYRYRRELRGGVRQAGFSHPVPVDYTPEHLGDVVAAAIRGEGR